MRTPHGLMASQMLVFTGDTRQTPQILANFGSSRAGDEEITRLKLENMQLKAMVRQTIGCLNDAQNILKNSGG